jgi:hypothetical protein
MEGSASQSLERTKMTNQGNGDGLLTDKQSKGVPRQLTRKNRNGRAFQKRRSSAGFGSSFGNILKFVFELKNMACHIFWPKAKRCKAPTERGRRSKSAERGRGFKWRAPTRSVGRRPFKPQTVLLLRRMSVGSEWILA